MLANHASSHHGRFVKMTPIANPENRIMRIASATLFQRSEWIHDRRTRLVATVVFGSSTGATPDVFPESMDLHSTAPASRSPAHTANPAGQHTFKPRKTSYRVKVRREPKPSGLHRPEEGA